MSLIFTALPVCEGDAFLLVDADKVYLFDSGINAGIVGILNNKGINTIDVAICSHNDNDHTDGFKALLKSNITIKEIWLPALWASIISFLINNKNTGTVYLDIVDAIKAKDSTEIKKMRKNADYMNSLFNDESISENELNDKLSEFTNIYEEFKKSNGIPQNKKNLNFELNNIIEIATAAYNNGCNIRWFEPCKSCTKNKVGTTDFVALNSQPVSQIKKISTRALAIRAICLTTVNVYSLLFEYYKNDIPVVRFSADSNQSCQSNNPYPQEIIITAPHHGSKSNRNVYQNIKGNDIIWVRGFHHSVKVCDEFLQCKNRYCVKCPNPPIFQEVSFEYSGNHWITQSGKCCQCKP